MVLETLKVTAVDTSDVPVSTPQRRFLQYLARTPSGNAFTTVYATPE